MLAVISLFPAVFGPRLPYPQLIPEPDNPAAGRAMPQLLPSALRREHEHRISLDDLIQRN
jgi:hypothetical protein